MRSVTSVNLHRFASGLLVEVVGMGQDDELLVRSFELDLVDAGGEVVRPRAPLAAGEASLFEEELQASGYRLEPSRAIA